MAGLLVDKSAIITGAASGIGEAAARLFVAEGARVVLADIDAGRLEALARELGQVALVTDVGDENAVRRLVDTAVQRFGRLDCAFNNAGMSGTAAPLEEISLAEFEQVVRLDLTSVFLCMKYEIAAMKRQGTGGAIVNTASGAGVIATPHLSPYCAAKHGVLGLTRTAAVENATNNIRVNAVLPGATRTPMVEASLRQGPEAEKLIMGSLRCGRFGKPEEIAEAAMWLLSDRASFVSGDSMLVDLGAVAR